MTVSILSFLKLIRLPNLVIMAMTMYMTRYMVILSILLYTGSYSSIPDTAFHIIVASVILIAAAGNIYNDLEDVGTDLINKGEKLPALRIGRNTLLYVYYILTLAGVIAGSVVTVMSGISIGPPILIFCAGLLHYYTSVFKRLPAVGNFVIAILIGILVALPLVLDENALRSQPIVYLITFYTSFAFLITLSREIIKDCEDQEGDLSEGLRTLPIVLGTKISRRVSGLLVAVILAGIIYIQVISEQWTSPIPFYYVVVFMELPLSISLFRLLFFGSSQDRDRIDSLLLKIIMITGVSSMLVFNYFQ